MKLLLDLKTYLAAAMYNDKCRAHMYQVNHGVNWFIFSSRNISKGNKQ